MTDSTSLYALAHELLLRCATLLAATPNGAPDDQYVSHGPPAFDCCNLLAVHAGVIGYAPLSRAPEGGKLDPRVPVVPRVPLVVTVVRCATGLPEAGIEARGADPAKLDADAQVTYSDGWTLMNGLYNAYKANTLFPGFPCRVADLDSAQALPPGGGCIGWTIVLTVDLDGFTPTGTAP